MDTQTLNIQIGLFESIIGCIVFVFSIGLAYGCLKTDIKNIKESLDELKADTKNKFNTMSKDIDDNRVIAATLQGQMLGQAHSPTTPNARGVEILKEMNFEEFYKSNKTAIFEVMDQSAPKTLFDVERTAFVALDQLKDNDLMIPVKEYAVHHPEFSIEVLFLLMSWVIRDDYAQARGIK